MIVRNRFSQNSSCTTTNVSPPMTSNYEDRFYQAHATIAFRTGRILSSMGNCCSNAEPDPRPAATEPDQQPRPPYISEADQQSQPKPSQADRQQQQQQQVKEPKQPVSSSPSVTNNSENEPVAVSKIKVQVDEPSKESSPPPSPRKDVTAAAKGPANSLLGVSNSPDPILVECRRVEDRYEVGRELGRGCFGIVRVCREKATGDEYAMKYVTKSAVKSYMLVQDEIRQLLTVGYHPNVVQLHDFFEDGNGFYIVMEYCRGGDLFARIVSEGSYSEARAAELLRQLASAIQHMHNNKIAHRDLKPENLLLMTKDPNSPLKVVDFGLSKFVNTPQGMMSTVIGTWAYCAPEVFSRKPYTEKVDNWALGVLMFIMLAGYHPFDVFGDSTEPMLIDNICKGRFDFSEPEWQNISQEAKNIISQLLKNDPNARMSIEAFLNTDWVNGKSASTSILDQSQKRLQLRISTTQH